MKGSETQRLQGDSSTASLPRQEYLSIPLPPRKTPLYPSPKTAGREDVPAKKKKSSRPETPVAPEPLTPPALAPAALAPAALAPQGEERRKEFLQSLVSAFAVNGLLVAFLIFTVVKGRTPPPPSLFEVTLQPDQEKASDESGGSSPAKSPSMPQEATQGAAAPATSVVTTTSIQNFSLTPEIHTKFSPSATPTDLLAPAMGASLQADAFASVKAQRKEAIKKFVESSTKGGNQGDAILALSEDQLRGLISTDEFGDGSGMMLLTDISGSMREIGEMIDSYVEKTFPKSSSTEIVGCSFKYLTDPVIKEITHTARRGKYTDYVFVCDLQDGEGAGAVQRLRKALLSDKRTIRLHVISFDQHPGQHLNRLIMDTGGAFTRVSRVTALPVP